MKRQKSLVEQLDRIIEQTNSIEDEEKKKVFITKCIELFEKNLTIEEKVIFTTFLIEEASFRKVVEHPDFLLKQSNMKIRNTFFNALIVVVVMMIAGLIFTDNPIRLGLNKILDGIMFIFKIG